MIGRFSQLGAYRELLRSGEFLRAVSGGGLALASYLLDSNPALICDGLNSTGGPALVSLLCAGGREAQAILGAALALVSVAINGSPIIWGALRGIFKFRVNVDKLVSLAILASLVQGEYLTAAVVSFVMVMGSLVEQATSDSARRAIHSLISISPETATVLVHGVPVTKSISEVKGGEVLLVRPGDRIPVDATVARGASAVDESSMTGEPIPRDKAVGDSVYAGTLNLNGVLEIEATRVGEETTLGKIIRLVSEAEAHKPEAVKLMDRYAHWFTPAILACSAAAWWFTGDPGRAVTVLIVGCPCPLILAAPTAIVATIGRAAKAGILVKGGQYHEEAGRATVVLFDKTGTLTEGKPRVDEVFYVEGIDTRDVLTLAACVEQSSTHPLARAVLKAAHYARVTLSQAEEF